MADIEFKRRGTPLWLVLLVLAVLGIAAYFIFERRGADPAQQVGAPADSAAAAAPVAAAAPAGPQGAAPLPPPAGNSGAAAEFVRFLGAQPFPATGAAAQRTQLTQAVRHMSGVVQQHAPGSGLQIVLLNAVADTMAMPDTKPERLTDLTQLAFYAFGHAMGENTPVGRKLTQLASQIQLGTPIGEQVPQVRSYFAEARDVVRDPQRALQAAPPPTAPPPAPAAPRP